MAEKTVTLSSDVFIELLGMYEDKQRLENVELDDAVASQSRWLFAYSKDGLAYRSMMLFLYGDRVYAVQTIGAYLEGYPLTDDMNRYIVDTVFDDSM